MKKAGVYGTDKLVKRLIDLGAQGERMADAVVSVIADEFVVRAKQQAPADLGQIRQNIGKEKLSIARYSIYSASPHAGYMEFGTGPQVDIPSDFATLAARVRNRKGGNFDSFVLAMTDWVRRKGLPVQAAYPIARSILRKGLRPRPYFYPNYVIARKELPKRLEIAVKRMVKK